MTADHKDERKRDATLTLEIRDAVTTHQTKQLNSSNCGLCPRRSAFIAAPINFTTTNNKFSNIRLHTSNSGEIVRYRKTPSETRSGCGLGHDQLHAPAKTKRPQLWKLLRSVSWAPCLNQESPPEQLKKVPCSENLRISSWSYDMEGHAKKCVERYCELAGHVENYTTIELRKSRYGAAGALIDFTEEIKHTETNPMCSIHKSRRTSCWRWDQNSSFGMICPGDPHQRNPNASKFEDRSQEETERQERCAREAAWKLAKNFFLKKKQEEKFKLHSSHLRKIGACLHQILNLRNETLLSTSERRCTWPARRTWFVLKWILWRNRVVLR